MYIGDLPFVIYFDFETSAGSDLLQDKKNVHFELLHDTSISPKSRH